MGHPIGRQRDCHPYVLIHIHTKTNTAGHRPADLIGLHAPEHDCTRHIQCLSAPPQGKHSGGWMDRMRDIVGWLDGIKSNPSMAPRGRVHLDSYAHAPPHGHTHTNQSTAGGAGAGHDRGAHRAQRRAVLGASPDPPILSASFAPILRSAWHVHPSINPTTQTCVFRLTHPSVYTSIHISVYTHHHPTP